MRRILIVKKEKEGFTLNDKGEKEVYAVGHDYDAMQDAIGAVVINFLNDCGGDACTIVIEKLDK